jgi:adenosylcobinamide-phosphate synthase
MAREVALAVIPSLGPDPTLLAIAVVLDLAIGDPRYAAHPVCVIGAMLSRAESMLRRLGADGYFGGILLFLLLGGFWTAAVSALVVVGSAARPLGGRLLHLFFLYSLLALGELLRYGWRVERALGGGDLATARRRVSELVGRDTDRMDAGACRRAVIESWSENLTDGFVSPLVWYALLGLPGLVLFKVVSTMDSMVGYKTPRYLHFGWCGARMDDVMNFVPARLTWVLLSVVAIVVPGCSAVGSWRFGWRQHGLLPSPNSGWSEAAAAGAIRRRLVGPIWSQGKLVTDIWLGDPANPPAADAADIRRAGVLVATTGIVSSALVVITFVFLR